MPRKKTKNQKNRRSHITAHISGDKIYVRLKKKPLAGKIIHAKIVDYVKNLKLLNLLKKIKAFPDDIKYPPSNVVLSEDAQRQVEEYTGLVSKLNNIPPKAMKENSKYVRLRVLNSKYEKGRYLCECEKT